MRNDFSFSYLAKSRCVTPMESAQEVKSRYAWQSWSMGLYCAQERHDVGDRLAVMGLLNVFSRMYSVHFECGLLRRSATPILRDGRG